MDFGPASAARPFGLFLEVYGLAVGAAVLVSPAIGNKFCTKKKENEKNTLKPHVHVSSGAGLIDIHARLRGLAPSKAGNEE